MENYEVRVIANPMAGKDEPVFGALAAAFGDADVRWNIDVTNGPGEEGELAKRAVAEGARVVVAFGGDGTVSAVADAIAEHDDVVLGVLPGGTANVFARTLGIPLDLDGAAKLLAGPHEERPVDLGIAELEDGTSRTFILRVSVGLEASAVADSSRESKEQLGELAYIITALRKLPERPVAHYVLKTGDGERAELDGLFAILANSGHMGMGEAVYAPDIAIDDGRLDGLIAPAGVGDLVNAAANALSGGQSDAVERLGGRELSLTCDPPQPVTVDGEVMGETPVRARVRPSAVKVIAPLREAVGSERVS